MCLLATHVLPAAADVPREEVRLSVKNGPEFVSGDTVRFDATLSGNLGSRYVYVELLDPFGIVHGRVKVKERDGHFAGYMPLDRELPEATYTLAAYTMYMRNRGADYFFRQPLDVRSIYSYKYRIEPEFDADYLSVELSEIGSGAPVKCESLMLYGPKGVIFDAGRKKSSYRFRLPDDVATVKVKFDNYAKFIAVPVDSTAAILKFYPEGGALIPSVSNAVGIKATDADGRPMSVVGEITDLRGDSLCRFRTDSLGVAEAFFYPVEGEKYFARVGARRFPLPQPDASASALQVVVRDGHYVVNVKGHKLRDVALEVNVDGITRLLETNPSFPLVMPYMRGAEFTLLAADGAVISSRPELLASAPESRTVDAFPVEIGGEISGTIRSRWRGKPLKNASVNILAPSINVAISAPVDENGRFRVDGIDWPDGTLFAIQAINPKGDREHNFTVDADTFPTVTPLPQPLRFNRCKAIDVDPVLHSDIMLNEIIVTARRSPEESFTEMFKSLGARHVSQEDIQLRSVTTYEQAIRAIPSLRIVNGRVISTRAVRGISSSESDKLPEVPLCVGGMMWNGNAAGAAPEPATPTTIGATLASPMGATDATNGMPAVASVSVNLSAEQIPELETFAATYPFHMVESLMYIPPGLAAAYGGGSNGPATTGVILVTLKKDTGRNDLFMQIHRPLGYQTN